MKAREDRLSLIIGYPSIALQFMIPPLFASGIDSTWVYVLGWILAALSVIGCIAAFVLYAKAKGQNPAYGALGVIWPVAIIVITSLPDIHRDAAAGESEG